MKIYRIFFFLFFGITLAQNDFSLADINPASETLSAIFGDGRKHARAAVSTNSIPLGAAVEIDAIFEIK